MTPDPSSDLVAIAISAGGLSLPVEAEVRTIRVSREANQQPAASILMMAGDLASDGFPLSSHPSLQPGQAIEIKAGYQEARDVIFKGLIQRLRLHASSNGRELILECADASIVLQGERKDASFTGKTDAEVMTDLITRAGLKANVEATSLWNEKLEQVKTSDWDFLRMRAEANGMLVLVHDGAVQVVKPTTTEPKAQLEYGVNVLELDAQIGTARRLHGSARIPGDPALLPGQSASLSGVSSVFDSDALFVSGVEHQIADGNWTTTLRFGLPD